MSKKILIIDDEPGILKLLQDRLKVNQYTVVTAQDGEEGLAKINSEQPDLIILDIMMPKMDGFTFVREYKRLSESKIVPIIVLTAKENLQDIFKMEGVKDYLLKPFAAEDLLTRVKKLIG